MSNDTAPAHTPGPWHIFSLYAQYEVRTPTDTLVAVVNSRQDAKLFRAAPDLLAALQASRPLAHDAVLREGASYGRNFSEHRMEAARQRLARIDAAIALATGVTP